MLLINITDSVHLEQVVIRAGLTAHNYQDFSWHLLMGSLCKGHQWKAFMISLYAQYVIEMGSDEVNVVGKGWQAAEIQI